MIQLKNIDIQFILQMGNYQTNVTTKSEQQTDLYYHRSAAYPSHEHDVESHICIHTK